MVHTNSLFQGKSLSCANFDGEFYHDQKIRFIKSIIIILCYMFQWLTYTGSHTHSSSTASFSIIGTSGTASTTAPVTVPGALVTWWHTRYRKRASSTFSCKTCNKNPLIITIRQMQSFFIFQFPNFAEFTNIIQKGYCLSLYMYMYKTKEEVKITKINQRRKLNN